MAEQECGHPPSLQWELNVTLDDARKLALALPSSSEEPHHHLTSFRVNGKIFATAPPEEEYLHVFVDEDRRELALAMYPDACEPLTWGKKTVGVRVRLSVADAGDVEDLLHSAWALKAPAKLVDRDS